MVLSKAMLERKLEGRRDLQILLELVKSKPLVSAQAVARLPGTTPQAAGRIFLELGLREMTGRRRFQAWGII